MNALAGLLPFALLSTMLTGFVITSILGHVLKVSAVPVWAKQGLSVVVGVAVAFVFRINALPIISTQLGGHIASLGIAGGQIVTGVILAGGSNLIHNIAPFLTKVRSLFGAAQALSQQAPVAPQATPAPSTTKAIY